MDQSITGMLYLGAIVLICSVIAHSLQKQFWVAVGLAALGSTALLLLVIIYRTGFLSSYLPIAVAITLVISTLCAMGVGAVFVLVRKLRQAG